MLETQEVDKIGAPIIPSDAFSMVPKLYNSIHKNLIKKCKHIRILQFAETSYDILHVYGRPTETVNLRYPEKCMESVNQSIHFFSSP